MQSEGLRPSGKAPGPAGVPVVAQPESAKNSPPRRIPRRFSRKLPFFLLLCACFAARAGTGGNIDGTVTDPSGARMAGVAVSARNTDTGVTSQSMTNGEGFYAFTALAPGRYELQIEHPGFQPFVRKGLEVTPTTTVRADVELALGERGDTILVTESPTEIETSSTQSGERISATKLAEVPVNGRSYTDLLALQPGVIPTSSQQPNAVVMAGCSSTPPSGDLNPGNVSVSGQRETANGFFVNGGAAQEDFNMGTAIVPNLDSIQEFRILTNNFDAE